MMPEKLVGKYMIAYIMPQEAKKKTRSYHVLEERTELTLGHIRWYGAWHSYCFFPEGGVVFDGGCLAQLDAWLSELTETYKDSKKEAANG